MRVFINASVERLDFKIIKTVKTIKFVLTVFIIYLIKGLHLLV